MVHEAKNFVAAITDLDFILENFFWNCCGSIML